MAEPSPPENEGQEPENEGQEPDEESTRGTDEPGKARSYPESYVRQLRREAATARNRASELEEKVEEFASRDKTEFERLTDKMGGLERRATEAETRLLRYEIAVERGLSMEAAHFLTGSTREEIEHRAEELAKLLDTQGAKPTASFDGGARARVPEARTPEEQHQTLLAEALGRRPRS